MSAASFVRVSGGNGIENTFIFESLLQTAVFMEHIFMTWQRYQFCKKNCFLDERDPRVMNRAIDWGPQDIYIY